MRIWGWIIIGLSAVAVIVAAALWLLPLAFADPYFTCKPYPKGENQGGEVGVPDQPFEFEVIQDGAAVVSPSVANLDGTVTLMYDLKGMTVGVHTIKAAARNAAGPSGFCPVLAVTKTCTSKTCKFVYTKTEGSYKSTWTVTVPTEGQSLGLTGKVPLAIEAPDIITTEE